MGEGKECLSPLLSSRSVSCPEYLEFGMTMTIGHGEGRGGEGGECRGELHAGQDSPAAADLEKEVREWIPLGGL